MPEEIRNAGWLITDLNLKIFEIGFFTVIGVFLLAIAIFAILFIDLMNEIDRQEKAMGYSRPAIAPPDAPR